MPKVRELEVADLIEEEKLLGYSDFDDIREDMETEAEFQAREIHEYDYNDQIVSIQEKVQQVSQGETPLKPLPISPNAHIDWGFCLFNFYILFVFCALPRHFQQTC